MNAFELFAVLKLNNAAFKKGLKDSESDAEQSGSKLSGAFGKIAQVGKALAVGAVAAFSAAGAGVTKITKQAVQAYGQYEQLVGGVEKLFGKSAKTVQQYADQAYKTAGMSANEYMETVTSFSASLISSLGGDTAKSAKYADMAIQDMSDNANVFGSDIKSIQTAYAGFAKQNYTMLDNLKLGYGGTKTEMERLIQDANKLKVAQGQTGDLTIEKYSDVVEAIHLVQEEMNITGTTQKEASKTIEGSINSTKAAWQNFITGLGNSNADIKSLAKDVIDSAKNVATNVIPIIKNVAEALPSAMTAIVQELPGLLNALLPTVKETITAMIKGITDGSNGVLPNIINLGKDIMLALADSIVENAPSIMNAGINAVLEFVSGIVDMLPKLISAGVQVISSFLKGIGKALPKLIPQITKAVNTMVKELVSHIPDIINAAIKLFSGFVKGINKATLVIVKELPSLIKGIIDGLLSAIPELINGFIELMTSMTKAIPEIITELAKSLPDLITGIVTSLIEHTPDIIKGFIDLFSSFISAVPEIIKGIVTHLPEIIAGIVKGLLKGAGEIGRAFTKIFEGENSASAKADAALKGHLLTLQSYQKQIQQIKPDIVDYNQLVSSQGNTISDLDSLISEKEAAITKTIKTAIKKKGELRQEDLDNIQTYMDEIKRLEDEKFAIYEAQQKAELLKVQQEISTLDKQGAHQHLANAQQYYDDSLKAADTAYTNEISAIESKYQSMGEVGSKAYQKELAAAQEHYNEKKAAIDGILGDTVSVISTRSQEWIAEDGERWKTLTTAMQAWNTDSKSEFENFLVNAGFWTGKFEGVKDQYKTMVGELSTDTTASFLAMQQEYVAANGTLTEESKTMVSNILGAFDNLPEDLDAAGKDALLGLIAGFKDQIPGLEDTSDMTANDIVDTIKKAWDIHSPSKVFQSIGQNAMDGLISGFTDKQGEAEETTGGIVDVINKIFTDNEPEMTKTGSGMINKMSAGFKQTQHEFVAIANALISTMNRTLVAGANSIVASIKRVFEQAKTILSVAGGFMAQGVAEGFLSKEQEVTLKVIGMMSRLTTAVKDKMKIESPSKVFAQIGAFLAQGLAIGIEKDADKAVAEAVSMADSVQHAMDGLDGESVGVRFANDIQAVPINGQQGKTAAPVTINMTVNGVPGQDVQTLADLVIERLQRVINREVTAYV